MTFADLQAERERLIARPGVELFNMLLSQVFLTEKLTLEIAQLKRLRFGASSEASALLDVQGQLFPVDSAELPTSDAAFKPRIRSLAEIAATDPVKPKRTLLPPALPRTEVILDLPEAEKAGLVLIGTEQSEKLHYEPGQFSVVVTVRSKYAQLNNPDAGVRYAPLVPCVIPGGLLDASVIAQVAVAKFADHQPLSRQVEIFKRSEVELSVSMLSETLLCVADIWLKPLVSALWRELKSSLVMHVDETVLATLPEKGKALGKTRKTRLWTYTVWGIVLYHYTEDKAGAHVREVLANWPQGRRVYLQADAASNYDALYRQQPLIHEVGCWAHARRKFFAIAEGSKVPVFAHTAIALIDQLFAIEREIKPLADADKLAARQAQARPVLAQIKQSFDDKLHGITPKSPTAGAISYVLKNMAALSRYTEQAYLKPDNNAAERALRKAALGRKNFLFVGSKRGGEAAAVYYSLIETAKANGLEPWAWLKHVLNELPKRKTSNYDDVKDLLPIKRHA